MFLSSITEKLEKFWHRYEHANLKIAFALISLQLVHLYWLTTDVVIRRIAGDQTAGASQTGLLLLFFIIIDYIEIPALVAGLTYYAVSVYKRSAGRQKNALLLILLAVQAFHIFWITDDVVFRTLFDPSTAVRLPYVAAWVAILVDYLELPVMVDLFYRTIVKGARRESA